MLLTGHEDIDGLSKDYRTEKAPFSIPTFLGRRELSFLRGPSNISLVDGALSAPVAAAVLEVAIAMGCKRLFVFGLCGSISPDLRIGGLVIPSEVIREEGASHHYAPFGTNATPSRDLLKAASRHFRSSES